MPLHRRLNLVGWQHSLGLIARLPIAAYQGDPAGAGQLEDFVGTDLLDESLDFTLLPRNLDHELVGAYVDDPAAEDLNESVDLGPKRAGP